MSAERPASPTLPPAEATPVPPALPPKADAPAQRRKRLTLQERLALAAKAKKKLPADVPLAQNLAEFALRELLVDEPQQPAEKPPDKPAVENAPPAPTAAAGEGELLALEAQLAALAEENAALRAAQPADVAKKIAEKDTTIAQLMEEGQALSRKELKLNERVRALAANNAKLEASLLDYASKNEEALLKLSEIDDIMKTHKLKLVDQLLLLLDTANQKAADAKNELDREKNANWELKYKELQRLYESELTAKKQAMRELSDANIQLQMLETQSRLELGSKDDIIAHLNLEIIALKDENTTEVARLELKLEGLRLENESFLKMSQNGAPSTADADVAHKQIDYLDYAKLSETHRNLQAQYVSSQENWKLIESNLLSKVETLSASLELLKKGKLKGAAEVRKLHGQLNVQSEQIEALQKEIADVAAEKKELAFRLQVKERDLVETEEKIEELKGVFHADRQNQEIKIKALTENIANLEAQASVYQASASTDNLTSVHSRRFRESGLNINLDMRPPMRNFSSNSFTGLMMNTPTQPWEEANATPVAQYALIYENNNISLLSLNEEIYPYDASDAADTSYTMSALPLSLGATKNIQLINKMSSSIRRLELEILTLKDENETLSREKDVAQQEIVNRLSLDKKVGELEASVGALQKEVEARTKKEETLLEVIGEKSERVAELQADVSDLKDLLRQQVQQMIEMSESS